MAKKYIYRHFCMPYCIFHYQYIETDSQISFYSQVIYTINIQYILCFLHKVFKIRLNVKAFSFKELKCCVPRYE
jgi:hypothetical protein